MTDTLKKVLGRDLGTNIIERLRSVEKAVAALPKDGTATIDDLVMEADRSVRCAILALECYVDYASE